MSSLPDSLALYDYELPPERIAQYPVQPRDASRLMLVQRGQEGVRPGAWQHHVFSELPGLLPPDALVVVNNTRVSPRRLAARLPSGVEVEALLVEEEAPGLWRALVKKAKRVKPGMSVPFAEGHLTARALERTEEGLWRLEFAEPETLPARLEVHGLAPLPPYIRRDVHNHYDPALDRADYQTCYASRDGAIAAPTAGLHITPAVLEGLDARGIERAELTLHVGAGTFAKIDGTDLAGHVMHAEWVQVPPEVGRAVLTARAAGRPVIAVGTTTVRALESWAQDGCPEDYRAWSRLFIRPPFEFRVVDGLVTNFHLPRSTLLLLVSALIGRERLLAAYSEAILQAYRFYSYGDAMLILPD